MCSVIAPFIKETKNDTNRAISFLRPLVEERIRTMAELGEGWSDKPVSRQVT